jgi:hypothetical protein
MFADILHLNGAGVAEFTSQVVEDLSNLLEEGSLTGLAAKTP